MVSIYFQNIHDIRIDHDLTQEDVAAVLHCKRGVYQRYEAGTREIPVWALIKLAELYGTTTDYLLGLSEERDPPKKQGAFKDGEKSSR